MPQARKRFLHGVAASLLVCAGCASKSSTPLGSLLPPDSAAHGLRLERASGAATGTLSIGVTSQTNGAIGSPSYAGFSYEKQVVGLGTFDASNVRLVGLFKRLGPSRLRIGGSTVDTNVWDPHGAGHVLDVTSRRDLERLAAFLAATNWVVAYGIRYKATGADAVADEAAAAASILGASLVAFEIGNEPDGYTTEPAYAKTWEQYRNAILARVPKAAFMAPETAAADAFFADFAAATAGQVAALSAHHYTGSAHDPGATVDRLLHSDERGFLAKVQRTWLTSQDPSYRIGETNSLYGGGKDGVSNTFASALWAVRYLLEGARYGCAGFHFHGGTSTQFGHELYYSPIRFAGTTGTKVIGVAPEYYGLLLATLVGTGPSYVTTVTGSPLVFAYAIGKTVVLLNLSQAAFKATVTLPGPLASARSIVLESPGGAAATHGQTLGGSAVGLDGSFSPSYANLPVSGATFTTAVPGISATLVATA